MELVLRPRPASALAEHDRVVRRRLPHTEGPPGEGPQLGVEAPVAPADAEAAPSDLVDLRHRLPEAEVFVQSGVGWG